MPFVKIDWLVGRDNNTKKKLIEGILKAFDDVNINADKVHIIINDVPKTNWAHKRKMATEW